MEAVLNKFLTTQFCAKQDKVKECIDALEQCENLNWVVVVIVLNAAVGASIRPALFLSAEIVRRNHCSPSVVEPKGFDQWVIALLTGGTEQEALKFVSDSALWSSSYACQVRGICHCDR